MYKEVHVLNFTIYIVLATPVNVKIHRSFSSNKRILNMLKTGTQHPVTYCPIKFIFRERIKSRRKHESIKRVLQFFSVLFQNGHTIEFSPVFCFLNWDVPCQVSVSRDYSSVLPLTKL